MFTHVDCNAFFASCEQLIKPHLYGKPVVVLSSNDGIIVALTKEAKAIGLKRGDAKFKVIDIMKKNNVHYFSGNGDLYDDISERVMTELGMIVPDLSVYSCDEAFANLYGIRDIPGKVKEIKNIIIQNTGIPISQGVAPTKVLCKIANIYSKKHPGYNGICMIDTEAKRKTALELTDVSKIWGIGDSYTKILKSDGVKTAYDFSLKKRSWVRMYLSVVGERIHAELNGEPCIITDMPEIKKEIRNTRTFGEPIKDFDELLSALVYFADLGIKKVRKQKSLAKGVGMFISTNRFKNDPYYASRYIRLPYATLDIGEITGYLKTLLQDIYKPGLLYNQAGVIYSHLEQQDNYQFDFLDTTNRYKQYRLAKAIDNLDEKFGFGAVHSAVQDFGSGRWKPKANFITPGSTRCLKNAIKVKVGNKCTNIPK